MSRLEWVIRGPEQRRQAPALKDYAWEHEQQLVTQRKLLEALRYKRYASAGTLGSFMQRLGDFGRTYFGYLDRKRTGGGWW